MIVVGAGLFVERSSAVEHPSHYLRPLGCVLINPSVFDAKDVVAIPVFLVLLSYLLSCSLVSLGQHKNSHLAAIGFTVLVLIVFGLIFWQTPKYTWCKQGQECKIFHCGEKISNLGV